MTSKWELVAPIDLSRPAEAEVQYAFGVATALGADLHLLHVIDDHCNREAQKDWPANRLSGEDEGIDVFRVVLQGLVASTIAHYADSISARLLLMTSHRNGRWNPSWRKSVTEDVMRVSRLPLCIALPKMADGNFRFRNHRILCVLGFNSNEFALVHYAEEMAQRTTADLVLLHVVPESSEALLHDAVDGGSRPLSTDSATARLDDLARRLRARPTTSVMVGESHKCIGLTAAKQSVDLVLVSRANGGLQATYGCDLLEMLETLRCPLLTICG